MSDYKMVVSIKCGSCGTVYTNTMPYPCPECERRRKGVMAPPEYPDIFITCWAYIYGFEHNKKGDYIYK